MRIGSYKNIRYRQDYELWFRAAASQLIFHNIPEPLIKYRVVRQIDKKANFMISFKMFLIGFKGCVINKTNALAFVGNYYSSN